MALCHHKWAEAFATWQGEAAEKERRARRAAEAKEGVSWWDGSGDAVRLVGDDEATRSPRRGFGGDLDRSSASVAALAPAPPGYMRTTDSRRHKTGRRQSVYSPTKRAPRTPAVPRVDAGWSRRLEAAELGASAGELLMDIEDELRDPRVKADVMPPLSVALIQRCQ